MKKLVTVLFVLAASPTFAQQQQPLSPVQQYIYNESGYLPQQQVYAPPVYAAPTYALPQPVAEPVPVAQQPATTVAQAYNNAQTYDPQHVATPGASNDDGLYDATSNIGPGEESPGLRALLTSSGF